MWFRFSVLKAVEQVKQKNFSNASQTIDTMLYQDKLYEHRSIQFIHLLHFQSILQFHLRQYEKSEISIYNAILQIGQEQKELVKLKKLLIEQYFMLLSYTCPDECEHGIQNEIWKHHFPENSTIQSSIKFAMAIGNQIDDNQSLEVSFNTLDSIDDSDYNFLKYYNKAVLDFNHQNKNSIQFLIQAFIENNDLTISSPKEISDYYLKEKQIEEEDVKIIILLIQLYMKWRQQKSATELLNYLYKQVKQDNRLNYYLPEVQFLYAVLFVDTKQKDNALVLCDKILESDLHPLLDALKVKAFKLKCVASGEFEDNENKIKLDEEIQEMNNELNIPEQGQVYYQLMSPLRFSNLHYLRDDFYIKKNKIISHHLQYNEERIEHYASIQFYDEYYIIPNINMIFLFLIQSVYGLQGLISTGQAVRTQRILNHYLDKYNATLNIELKNVSHLVDDYTTSRYDTKCHICNKTFKNSSYVHLHQFNNHFQDEMESIIILNYFCDFLDCLHQLGYSSTLPDDTKMFKCLKFTQLYTNLDLQSNYFCDDVVFGNKDEIMAQPNFLNTIILILKGIFIFGYVIFSTWILSKIRDHIDYFKKVQRKKYRQSSETYHIY
ncbi:hypothetical protein pb186bvf_014144 [Paramecium bursaria]